MPRGRVTTCQASRQWPCFAKDFSGVLFPPVCFPPPELVDQTGVLGDGNAPAAGKELGPTNGPFLLKAVLEEFHRWLTASQTSSRCGHDSSLPLGPRSC